MLESPEPETSIPSLPSLTFMERRPWHVVGVALRDVQISAAMLAGDIQGVRMFTEAKYGESEDTKARIQLSGKKTTFQIQNSCSRIPAQEGER